MAYQAPAALAALTQQLATLPGVGAKAAQRLAFHLLAAPPEKSRMLAQALLDSAEQIHPCPVCGNFTDRELCPICEDSGRQRQLLCVVEQVSDLISMERVSGCPGLYHVLGGVISPLDGIGPEKLNIASLLRRVEEGDFREIIMATNPTVEGEATAQYLAKKLRRDGLKITRLAHGLPVGGTLSYVDEATLELAMSGRREL